ncbi:MAG: hypothetical protein LBQ57_11315 [Spirochaetales bacterium]|jgi:hypothetical protein|nr:hypothetical protein [Spirochaetales bacterium]
MKKMSVWFVAAFVVVSLLAGCGGSPVDRFEELVDETIALMKKAQSGDLSAMTDAAKLQEKLEKLTRELEEKEDTLSAEEQERLEKAMEKLLTSAF